MRILVVAIVLLAGCTSVPEPEAPAALPLPPTPPLGYALACPPGGSGDPCHVRIANLTESQQEPYAAAHPTNGDIFVVGTNAGHTRGAVLDPDHPGADAVRLDLWFSEDGGATWRLSTLPYINDPAVTFEPIQYSVIGDPAIVIDSEGVTHVSGIASHSRLRGYNVFYIQSTDLGRSWGEPIILTDDDDNDRNWMDIGPDGTLYVPWQNVGKSVQVAWSKDGGATWLVAPEYEDCITVSRMAFAGGAFVACTSLNDGRYDSVHVLQFEGGRLEQVGEPLGACIWPKLDTLSDGRLFLTAESCDGGAAWTVYDGAWQPQQKLRGLIAGAEWNILWQEDGPGGWMHFIMGGTAVRYVAVTLDGGFSDAFLRSADGNVPDAPDSIGPDYGDHYYGIAISGERALLAWTDSKGVNAGFAEPIGA